MGSEEHDGVNGGATASGIPIFDPVPDKREIKGGVEMTVEVVRGNEPIEREQDAAIQLSLLGRAEHRRGRTF